MVKSTVSALAIAVLATGPALAHPGHVADGGSGHAHWVALAALAGVMAIGAVALVRRYRSQRPARRDRAA